MHLTFTKLQHFGAEVSPVDLRATHDQETLGRIRAGMDEHAVLVFRDQRFSDDEQIAFAHLVRSDNRATMHRARPFDDAVDRRELRRVTTLDVDQPALIAENA